MENNQSDNITYLKTKHSFKDKLKRSTIKISDPEKAKMIEDLYKELDDIFDKLLPSERESLGAIQAMEEALEVFESLCYSEEQVALLEAGKLEISRDEIEKGLIGSILLKPELFDKFCNIIGYYHFENKEASISYMCMYYLHLSKRPIDISYINIFLDTLKNKSLHFNFDLDKEAIEIYLFDAQMQTPSPTYALTYACLLRKLNNKSE
jgi:hypothetical protein